VNVLLVNWQDRLNPLAGGAETHLHEIFGRLTARGHRVTLLASAWRGAPAREEVDGIRVMRTGGRYSFGLRAPRAGARLLAEERFDVVVEALNKVPTFAPAWARVPVVLLVHHLFGASAFQEANVAVASATWLLERPLAPLYRGVPVQVISRSTGDDLVSRGLRGADIEVIHPGIDLGFFTPSTPAARAAEPTFVYVGRLKRYKRVDLILHAVAGLRARGIAARLAVAGRGEWEPNLRRLAASLGIEGHVEFHGFVSEERKRDLFRSAWANVFVSPKEGWGMTNIEAAACGTATVASDSPGLRESVVDGRTGLLVPHADVAALTAALVGLATDRARVEELGAGALAYAQRFSWEMAAERTEAHLDRAVNARRTAAPAGRIAGRQR
jgi:glycosyltransferase involved in cell wall biosynthesis